MLLFYSALSFAEGLFQNSHLKVSHSKANKLKYIAVLHHGDKHGGQF